MSGTFDLWDIESGNMIGTWEDEAEALAFVRNLLVANGLAYANSLDLGWMNPDGRSRSIATGAALVDRAHAAEPALSDRGHSQAMS